MNAATIVAILSESHDADYNAAVDFHERRGTQLYLLADELKNSGGVGRVSWPRIPAARLKKIWLDYGKTGVVRDEKGLDAIADQMLTNIARLQAATEMMGHTQFSPREELEEEGTVFTDEEWDDWMSSYFTDERGNWTLSDYGLPKLVDIYGKIFNAATAEEKLQAVDRALNVIHQRSDLAALFVEGGSKTLVDIFNQGGYTSESEEDDFIQSSDVAGPTDEEDQTVLAAILPDVIARKEAYLGKKCVKTFQHTNPQGEKFLFGRFGIRNSTVATLLYFDPEKGWVSLDIRDNFSESEEDDTDDLKDAYENEQAFLPLGSISRGTTQEADLVQRFLFYLKTVAPDEADGLEEEWRETAPDYQSDFVWDRLWNVMNRHVPPYTYFGAHEGSGTDYGVWISREAIDNDLEYEPEKLQAVKEGHPVTAATPYVVVVNAAGEYVRMVSGVSGKTLWIDE